jgi:dual-specificity kinase
MVLTNVYKKKNNIIDKVLSFMGRGTFAKVVECWDRECKSYVAVKIVRSIPKYTDSAEIEVDILKDINGKCGCIELIDSFMFRKHMCLVFPKFGKSLFDFIKSNRYKGFYLEHVKTFARGILTAIKYLHCEKKLIHTDLKPENILLVNSEYYIDDHRLKVPKYTDIRIIDFGSATYEDQHHTSIISTRHYRAPEVILGKLFFVQSFHSPMVKSSSNCMRFKKK